MSDETIDNASVQAGSMRRRLGIGTAWIASARLAVNAMGLVGTFVLARLLTPSDFGLVALATALMAVLNSITEMSLTSALVQRAKVEAHHIDTAFTLNLTRAFLVAAVLAASAFPLAHFYRDGRLVGIALSLSLAVIATGFINPGLILLTRQLTFRQDFILAVAEKVAVLTVQLAGALIWRSYWALVLGTIAGPMMRAALSYRYAPHRPRLAWSGARELWSFSGWLTGAQILGTLNYKLDNFLVGWMLGTRSLGFYTLGDSIAQMPTREATAPLTQTLFPGFARVANDPERLRGAYERAQALTMAVAVPAGIGFALIADTLVRLVMGERWHTAIIVVQILASVFALQTLGSLVQPLAMATGQTRTLFWRDVLMLAIRIPAIVVGMVLGGLVGVVWARVFSGTAGIVISMSLVRSITGLGMVRQLRSNVRSLASALAMVAGVLLLQGTLPADSSASLAVKLGLSIAVGGVCYLGSYVSLWLLAGRPEGPETVVAQALASAAAHLFPRRKQHG